MCKNVKGVISHTNFMTPDEKKDREHLKAVREGLKKASEMEDPKIMWYFLRDIFNLLSMIVTDQDKRAQPGGAEGLASPLSSSP